MRCRIIQSGHNSREYWAALWQEKRERRGGWDKSQVERREGSVRVSQGDYTGEEGWEMEVCNWLPGED